MTTILTVSVLFSLLLLYSVLPSLKVLCFRAFKKAPTRVQSTLSIPGGKKLIYFVPFFRLLLFTCFTPSSGSQLPLHHTHVSSSNGSGRATHTSSHLRMEESKPSHLRMGGPKVGFVLMTTTPSFSYPEKIIRIYTSHFVFDRTSSANRGRHGRTHFMNPIQA